jgi:hypothetical protein
LGYSLDGSDMYVRYNYRSYTGYGYSVYSKRKAGRLR